MSSALLKLCFCLIIVCDVKIDCEVYQERPKIKTTDGDLIIVAAFDKNIYLQPNGPKSSIYFGNIDVFKRKIVADQTQYQESTNTDEYINEPIGILRRLEILENKVQSFVSNGFNTSLLRKVNRLNRKVIALQNIINNRPKDECSSQPCQHGGTCLNLVDGYHCLCPSNWEGKDCDVDVNECQIFAGTDLGCQNGAECINKPGTYQCLCKPDWFGLHCTRKAKDCSSGDFEMCGYGTCTPVTSGEGFQCICHQGWTHNATSVACLTDVNECESNERPRCSVNPKVECINLPGSFRCGQCPAGYEGDGYICNDINECTTIPNGGCSPKVSCHNTVGSRICSACPPGYQGDGITCSYRGTCNIDHGGCYSHARCIEELSPTGLTVQCLCPEGMDGDGLGVNGCYVSLAGCVHNPCGDHGRCRVNHTDYTCICYKGYSGEHCDKTDDICADNPCQNDGVCRQDAKSFRCKCTAQYTGSLCQVRLRSCGGVLDAEEGSIYYPLTNSSASNNQNIQCVWQIHTDADKILNVTFTKFNIVFAPECTRGFLQIHDGHKSSSHLIGSYCGNTLPKGGTIVSSQNNLYLWFHLDGNAPNAAFELHWISVKPVCGGVINASTHGHLSSPGSPGPYPPNRVCYWYLVTTPGKRIILNFFAIDIEAHVSCDFDYLAIYNGGLKTDPLIGRYCNTTQPPSVQSSGFNLLLYFHSDAYGSGNGFQIAYDTIDGIPGCGGNYSTDEGVIASPTYNGSYLNNLLCEYTINTSPDTKIQIVFKLFKLVNSVRCENDYLKIYDGPSAESQLVGTFCGSAHSTKYTSSSNKLYLKFRSDLSVTAEGFRITYKSVCENTLLGDSGVIKSPSYPNNYPLNKICIYTIRTEPGKAIELTFQDFDVEGQLLIGHYIYEYRYSLDHKLCSFDYVEIRDGPDRNSSLIGSYCGSFAQIRHVITSTHNYMYIKFKSDASVSTRGFYANYTTIDTECGGIYKNTTGLINYPLRDAETYENDQTCLWLLIAPEGMHIEVTWNRFDIENMPHCSSDYLDLIEIDENNKSDVLGRYCGTRAPPAFITSTNRLKVTFFSNKNIRSAGFSISYNFLNEIPRCGGNYIKSHGTIHFPGGSISSKSHSDCTWTITVPVGQQISLNIISLDFKELVRNQCKYAEYLEIRNGASKTSPLIGQYCGKLQSKRITSLSNALHIYFHSRPYNTVNGFLIEWDSTVTGCGGTLTSSSGTILSPNYPYDYHENAECFYKIVISSGSRIGISFKELELERTHSCHKDYVEIYDGRDTNAQSLGKYCSMSADLANIKTSSNFAFIKFRSDSFVGAKGFAINYHTICNNTVTGRHGVIESPGYPNDYPSNLKCWWTIQVNIGNTINVKFTHFDVAMKPWSLNWVYYATTDVCDSDYLQIRDIFLSNSSQKFCGTSLPKPISTKSNLLEIQFISKSYTPWSGFRLEWASYGCGGHIRKESGLVFYDKGLSSPDAMECEWLIETSPGTSINITFTNVYMFGSLNCLSDAIEVYNGQNTKAPLLTKICHKGDVSIKSDSNFMVVRFVKLSTMKDVHFNAYFNSSVSKCGGSIFSTSGYLYSQNYPKNYDNNLDCIWYITVPINHRIELHFIDLDLYSNSYTDYALETDNNLCNDSVLIYDTDNYTPMSNDTYRICQHSNMSGIVTKYNKVVVQFKTDSFGTAKGFKAYFSVTCGALISAKNDGVITNNRYLSHFNSSCIWTIIAPTPDQKISLTMTRFSVAKDANVQTNRNCPSTFFRVFDGNDKEAPLIDEFCGRKLPPMIVSHGNAITIELGSYTDIIFGVFSVHYSSISNACGGSLTADEGVIASPSYPSPYPANVDCEWLLSASPGNIMFIAFERFELEYSEGCNEDYIEIRENDGKGKLFAVYCGNNIPTNQTKAANIYIKFHSSGSTSGQGFLLHFGYLHEIHIQARTGELASPLYPARYEGSGVYSWRIFTFGIAYMVFIIDQLEIPSNGEISYNKLIIYDGYDNTSPILKQLHGALAQKLTFRPHSDTIYITLKMDDTNTGSIFHLSWSISAINNEIYEINCGSFRTDFILPGQAATLKSPNFPQKYSGNLNCEWIYRTQIGRHLSITFNTIDLRQSNLCRGDSISIYSADTLGNWQPIREKICESKAVTDEIDAANYMKITFTTTKPSHMFIDNKGFQATVKSKCGDNITDLSGEFGPTWFDANTSFSRNQQIKCNWTVTVRPGRTIKLKFVHFNISNENKNCNTSIILHNGDSVEGSVLENGKYYGDEHEKKTDLITSGNSLFVTYSSHLVNFRNKSTFQTFKIYYEEKNEECGLTGNLNTDQTWETINSPNYPSIPNPYTECVWVFTGPPGVILRVDFIERFDIDDNGDNCGTEVIEIRDGSSDLSPLIGRYCGKKPATIKSSSHSIYLKFFTQLSVPRNGFKANISIDLCGGTIFADSGEVKSPGYPQMQIPHETICEWHIIGKQNNVFLIQPLDIHLPLSQSECGTKIEIDDIIPLSNNYTNMQTICNDDSDRYTKFMESSSSNFIIKLTIGKPNQWDPISEYRGFRIAFNSSQVACGSKVTMSEGYLTTPNYPQETTVTICYWNIEVPNKSRRIRLELIDSNDEKHNIKIYNNHLVSEITSTLNINAASSNQIYESVANILRIYISLKPSARSHRFKAKFTSDEQALCGGELHGLSQELVTPDLKQSYSCDWHYNNQITTNNENVLIYKSIFIIINSNSSISSGHCEASDPFIAINSPVTNEGHVFNRKICGNTKTSYRIPSNIMDISASKSENDIFNFSLSIESQPCGGIVYLDLNPINIIQIPDSHNDTIDCAWLLVAPNENRIHITMEGSFLLECDEEYVSLMSDLDHNIPLYTYCKEKIMEGPITLHYTHMYIEYHSNIKNKTNIKLMAHSITSQCGGLITSHQRVFTSPNYPKSYVANQECAWEIRADIGFRVSLQFIDRFVIEDRPNCIKDAVIIYDWKDNAYEEVARVCGRHAPPPYNSTYDRLKVVLRTDAETNLDGFKAQWTPICGGIFKATEQEQILFSPGYPVGYESNMHCFYEILSQSDRQIHIKFFEFELEGTYPECMADNVTIYGIFFEYPPEIFCGNLILVVRSYQTVVIRFKTDSSIEKKGFKMAYFISSCGGRVNDSTVISSSTDDSDYESNLNCTWLIEAPPTKIVVVKFLYIFIQYNSRCRNDYIALYNGETINATKRFTLLCGHINSSTTLRSTENNIVMQFKTDYKRNDIGFKALIYFSYSEAVGCGGKINLTSNSSQILKSPLISNVVYENFLDCHWSITSPTDTIIKISFTKFNIAPCRNDNHTYVNNMQCDCDLVEIKDGINPNSLEIGTFCGYTLPPLLMSSGNIMSVRLSTDRELVSSGFEATLIAEQKVCGEAIIPVDLIARRLKSPNYDKGVIPRGLHCVYHLDTSGNHNFNQIRITVIDLQLRPSVDKRCHKDKLIISSTPYRSNNKVGRDLIMNFSPDNYFYRFYNFGSYNLPKRVELCGNRETIDLYMYGTGDTSINLITSSDTDNEIHRGFEIEVALVGFCGRNFTEMQGRIFSGSTPLPTSTSNNDGVDCYTLITVPENYTISLYFLAIASIPRYWNQRTYLEIFDGNKTSAARLTKIDTDVFYPAFSTGRYMLLRNHRFQSNSLKYDINYVATNKGVGCGGKLNNVIGTITSPLYPNAYRRNSVCEWTLETPDSTRLLIRFNVFELEAAFDENYLQLIDRKGDVVRTFSSESPADYTSDDNYLKVVFHSSMNNAGRGWWAFFAGI